MYVYLPRCGNNARQNPASEIMLFALGRNKHRSFYDGPPGSFPATLPVFPLVGSQPVKFLLRLILVIFVSSELPQPNMSAKRRVYPQAEDSGAGFGQQPVSPAYPLQVQQPLPTAAQPAMATVPMVSLNPAQGMPNFLNVPSQAPAQAQPVPMQQYSIPMASPGSVACFFDTRSGSAWACAWLLTVSFMTQSCSFIRATFYPAGRSYFPQLCKFQCSLRGLVLLQR